jgi:hypothetical protein
VKFCVTEGLLGRREYLRSEKEANRSTHFTLSTNRNNEVCCVKVREVPHNNSRGAHSRTLPLVHRENVVLIGLV